MKSIFLDTNILLEILFNRRLASKCESVVRDKSNKYAVSVITVHIVWYMAERYKLPIELTDDFLSVWDVLPATNQTLQQARIKYDGKDFEDCLQAACAEASNCAEIITIDKHFKSYSHTQLPVKVLK